ncbi:hypothetical protein GIB67_035000 [Kingdonia uniflora]|uniref:Uncharacterized protein n=1 Tax=Kingdonia uniflora TaxID=39325 RepID=A0A7J7N3Z1_9MAGN|nr:hypothetical protein GIB67_035000 [Kingdonia uniflora]
MLTKVDGSFLDPSVFIFLTEDFTNGVAGDDTYMVYFEVRFELLRGVDEGKEQSLELVYRVLTGVKVLQINRGFGDEVESMTGQGGVDAGHFVEFPHEDIFLGSKKRGAVSVGEVKEFARERYNDYYGFTSFMGISVGKGSVHAIKDFDLARFIEEMLGEVLKHFCSLNDAAIQLRVSADDPHTQGVAGRAHTPATSASGLRHASSGDHQFIKWLSAISAVWVPLNNANDFGLLRFSFVGVGASVVVIIAAIVCKGVPKLKRVELQIACEDFSNIICSSLDGTIYKRTLSSGVEIAVASTAVLSAHDWSTQLEAHFRKKIETLSNVNHKNFMNLLDLCEEEEHFTRMMVFEYAPNGTLFEHLHSGGGKLSVLSDPAEKDISISYELAQELGRGERAAAVVTKMIVEVVESCHIHGVIHRNLKAENFVFTNKKEIAALKAIDFGLSVFFKPSEHFTEIVGSPYYMAPKKAPNVSLGETVKARLKQFSVMNKLKKRTLRAVAENFFEEEFVGIKESFQLMDVNNNGKITLGELKVGLGKIGHNIPDVDHQMLMEAADVDGNGTLDFEEYVAVAIYLRKIENDEYLHKAFEFFDKKKSGYIEIEELRDALADKVDTNNEEVITAIIHDVDTKKFDSYEERLYDGHREKDSKVHAESDADSGGSLKVEPEKEGKSEEDVSQDVSEEGSDDESEEEEKYEMKKMRSYPDEIPDIFMLDSSHGRAGHSRNA